MKKLILAGACIAALAAPSMAQTVDAGTVLDAARAIYNATQRNNTNNGYYDINNQATYPPVVTAPNTYQYNNNNGYGPTTSYSLTSPVDVIFTNLAQGATVPSNFTLSGYTAPYNQVDLSVKPRGLKGGGYRNTVSANAQGQFSVNVDASQLPYDSTLAIRAQARSGGNVGPTREINVVRR